MMNTPALNALTKPAISATPHDATDQAARDFEAMFVTEMIKPMMETVSVDDTFGGGKGEEIFRGFMVDEYGKMIAKTGGIGLASHIKAALIAAQAGQKLPATEGAQK